MRRASSTSRCPAGNERHWFTYAGGLRSPVCIRCGSPNPKELTTDDWLDLGDRFPEKYGAIAAKVREQLATGNPS